MRRWALVSLLLALCLTLLLVFYQGLEAVQKALQLAGWALLVPVPLFLLSLLPASLAWYVLFKPDSRPEFSKIVLASWMGSSVNWLLPVAQIGGDVTRVLWLNRYCKQSDITEIAASTVVDKTLQALVQALVALLGVALLILFFERTDLLWVSLIFSIVLITLVAVFIQLQRHNLFHKLVKKASQSSVFANLKSHLGQAKNFDTAIQTLYNRPLSLLHSLFWRLVSRLVLALELWWILWALNIPVSFLHALLLESLAQTVRAASFMVPGSYGVQEGSFILLGRLFKISGEFSLALSLGKRVRELMVGIPALIILQLTLGFAFLRSHSADKPSG